MKVDFQLIMLFKNLVDGKLNTSSVKSLFSGANHYYKFVESIRQQADIRYLGEYLVILRKDGFVATVGMDESKNLFCHILPRQFDKNTFSMLNNNLIRRIMGFDKHLREIMHLELGVRLRFQGDLVIQFLKIFDSTRNVFGFLRQYLLHSIFLLPISFTYLDLEKKLIDDLSALKITFRDEESLVDYLLSYIDDIYKKPLDLIETKDLYFLGALIPSMYLLKMDLPTRLSIRDLKYIIKDYKRGLYSIMRSITNLEKQFSVRIGNHKVELVGIHMADINTRISYFNNNIFKSLSLPSSEYQTFITLRDQKITATHPEHKDAELEAKPSIFRILTLNTLERSKTGSKILDNSILHNSIYFAVDIISRLSRIEQRISQNFPIKIHLSGAIQIGLYDKISSEKFKETTIKIGGTEVSIAMSRITNVKNLPTVYFIVYEKEKILL